MPQMVIFHQRPAGVRLRQMISKLFKNVCYYLSTYIYGYNMGDNYEHFTLCISVKDF